MDHAALEGDAEIGEFGLGGFELGGGVGSGLLDVGIREHEDDAVGGDDGARAEDDFIDAALGAGGDPADFFGDEGAEAADVAEHLAAFHGVDVDEVAVDGGGGGLQAREKEGDADEHGSRDSAVNEAFFPFGFRLIGARDVHGWGDICNARADGGAGWLSDWGEAERNFPGKTGRTAGLRWRDGGFPEVAQAREARVRVGREPRRNRRVSQTTRRAGRRRGWGR